MTAPVVLALLVGLIVGGAAGELLFLGLLAVVDGIGEDRTPTTEKEPNHA